MHRNLEVTAFGPREVISEGKRAAAFGCFRLRACSTDRTVDLAFSIRFELRDGLITKHHFLANTFDVARAAFGQTAIGFLKPTVRNTPSPQQARQRERPFNRGLRAVSEKTDANCKYQHISIHSSVHLK